MLVMKFGGTSVQDAQAILRVVDIVRGRLAEKPLVVVSAFARVTRDLVSLAADAREGKDAAVRDRVEALRQRHLDTAESLLKDNAGLLEETAGKVEALCDALRRFALGLCRSGELSSRSEARILSHGELLSSVVVCAALRAGGLDCGWLDAREMIVTDDTFMQARPVMDCTEENIRRSVAAAEGAVLLTQGFIAATAEGAPTLLGFEGSDYSAALFGRALDASRIEIWTDVDGIHTADPRVIADTRRIARISYGEAAEMARLGARVLHPLTLDPARSKGIPVWVLQSTRPDRPGTEVVPDGSVAPGVKGLAWSLDADGPSARDWPDGAGQVSVVGIGVAADPAVRARLRAVCGKEDFIEGPGGLSLGVPLAREEVVPAAEKLHQILFAS